MFDLESVKKGYLLIGLLCGVGVGVVYLCSVNSGLKELEVEKKEFEEIVKSVEVEVEGNFDSIKEGVVILKKQVYDIDKERVKKDKEVDSVSVTNEMLRDFLSRFED